jgi:hypothetical protein
MPIDRIPSAGIESGGVAASNLSTGAPSWDSSGNLSFNSGYGSTAVAYGCRAWVNFNGTGTVAIRASGNVTSITDNGTGDYTINFTTAMPDANYAVNVTTMRNAVAGVADPVVGSVYNDTTYGTSYTTTSVRIETSFGSSASADPLAVNAAIFR